MAFPLLLGMLDKQLSSTAFQRSSRTRRMVFLQEVIRQLQQRYEVADDVLSFINKSLDLACRQLQGHLASSAYPCNYDGAAWEQMTDQMRYPPPGSRTKAWSELFIGNTRHFLRFSFSLDYALARGKFPEESNLDAVLDHPDGTTWDRLSSPNMISRDLRLGTQISAQLGDGQTDPIDRQECAFSSNTPASPSIPLSSLDNMADMVAPVASWSHFPHGTLYEDALH